MNKRMLLRCVPILLAGLLVFPSMALAAPQELTIQVEIEPPAPKAEILAFKHDASGVLSPGDRVRFDAEAVVPPGAVLQAIIDGTTHAYRLTNVGGNRYQGGAALPELKDGAYKVVAQIGGQGLAAVNATAPGAIQVKKPVIITDVEDTPPPPTPGAADLAAICSSATNVINGLKVRFDFDVDSPNLSATSNLDRITREIRTTFDASPQVEMTIEGHCDELGEEYYNDDLGKRRAESIKRALMKRGLDGSRIRIVSRGENSPLAPGTDEASRAKNRRAEFLLKCK